MSDAISIFPFENAQGLIRFGIQTAIFLIGLYVAHKLIIKPSLRLHEERRKRTIGNSEAARANEEKSKELEHDYFSRLKDGADAVHQQRAQEILSAQKTALTIVTESQQKANEFIKGVRDNLDHEMLQAKTQLLPQLDDIINSIYKKLGVLSLVILLVATCLAIHPLLFAVEPQTESTVPSFWYSIFWPYFQFALFLVVLVYFGRKPIKNMLQQRRDDFRAKLSEAHEAVYLADKKLKEYQAKVASLESELNNLKNRNMEEARLEKERIIKEAHKTSEIILNDAKRTANELINSSKEEIKKELFNLAISEVEKRLSADKLAILDKNFKQEAIENIKRLH